MNMQSVSPNQFAALVREGKQVDLIDVRTPIEYREVHLEAARNALEREIAEELGCVVEVGNEVTTTSHQYDFAVVTLTTFWCRLVGGTPDPSEHAAIKWLLPAELDTLAWAPADIPAVTLIRAQLTS